MWHWFTGNTRSMTPFAWGLIPLFLVIGLMIFFGDTTGERRGITVLEQTPGGERVWLGSTDIPDHAWSQTFNAPSDDTRAALLRALASFRGERVQQGIRLDVSAVDDNEAGRQVARTLGSALGQYNLGRAQPSTAEYSVHITQLRAAPRDRGLVHHLLAALSPYLKGEVWIQYDEGASTASMTLHLADAPLFGEDGTVWYGLDVQP